MYAIFTKTGGFHAPHGDGSRGGMAGYKLRYVMKVGGTGKTGKTKAKISAAKKGVKRTAATKAKISAAMKGKKRTAATKAKMSAAMKGNTNRMKKR